MFYYKKKIIIITIFILLGLNPNIRAEQKSSHFQSLKTGWNLYKQKKYNETALFASDFIVKNPDNLEAYYLRGISFYYLNKLKNSIADFTRIIIRDPSYYSNLYSWRGAAYFGLKMWKEAVRDLSRDLLTNPDDTGSLFRRARAYFMLKQYKKAIIDYNRILKLDADYTQIYLYRAQANFKSNQVINGFKDFFKGSGFDYLILVIFFLYLGGFILSFLVMKVIFYRKKYNTNEKYALFARYNYLSGLPLLFFAIYVLKEFNLWESMLSTAFVFLGENQIVIVLLVIFIVSLILYGFKIFHSIILSYYLQKKVRKVEISFLRYLKVSSLTFIYFFLVQLGFLLHMAVTKNIKFQGWLGKFFSFLLICLILYLVMNTYVWFISFFWGRLKDKEKELNLLYKDFFNDFNIKLKALRVVKTSDCKMANAWVTGMHNNQIFITDYLINNFTTEEVKGVLAHEIGHVKKKHIYSRFAIIVFLLISSYYIGIYINSYWIQMLYIIISITFIFSILFRYQENQADRFAIENIADPYAYLNALGKLASLNTSSLKLRKLEEKMQTHPSIAKRIYKLKKILDEKDESGEG